MGDLEPKINFRAVIARGIIAEIPVIGSIIRELMTEILPDRRFERIESLLAELSKRLDHLEPDTVRRRVLETGVLRTA